jgi:hypothetical protein
MQGWAGLACVAWWSWGVADQLDGPGIQWQHCSIARKG